MLHIGTRKGVFNQDAAEFFIIDIDVVWPFDEWTKFSRHLLDCCCNAKADFHAKSWKLRRTHFGRLVDDGHGQVVIRLGDPYSSKLASPISLVPGYQGQAVFYGTRCQQTVGFF